MINFRDPTPFLTPTRLRHAPFSNPVSVNRQQQEPAFPPLTNKQSVFGLFLDELIQYYKLMPMELDFSFPKAIRKIHSKGTEFATEEYLQKAAQILIEAKNKLIKQQIDTYQLECHTYMQRCPNALASLSTHSNSNKRNQLIRPRKIATRHHFKKILPQQKFFDRVKSEGKQQNFSNIAVEKRNSFLLHPKSIRFDSSNEILDRLQLSKQKRVCRLPKIAQSNRIFQDNIRTSIQKSKHIRVFFSPMNRQSNSSSERANLLKQILFSSKHSESTNPTLQRQESVLREKKYRHEVNIQLDLPRQEEEPKRQRKLMLQLLREKSKQALLSD